MSSSFPVRCISCGAGIGHLKQEYQDSFKPPKQQTADIVLDSLDINPCCRIHFLTAPEELANMVTQLSSERVHDSGCNFTTTDRDAENIIRVQRDEPTGAAQK